jgi:hypothetical protein
VDAAASGADERRLGMPGSALTGSEGIYGPAASEALTTTLRDNGQGGDAPYRHRLCAPAQVVQSRRPMLASRARVARVSDRSERHPLKRPTVKL